MLNQDSDQPNTGTDRCKETVQHEILGNQQNNNIPPGDYICLHKSQTTSNVEATACYQQRKAASPLADLPGSEDETGDSGTATIMNVDTDFNKTRRRSEKAGITLHQSTKKQETIEAMHSQRKNEHKMLSDERPSPASQHNPGAPGAESDGPVRKRAKTKNSGGENTVANNVPPFESPPAPNLCAGTPEIKELSDAETEKTEDVFPPDKKWNTAEAFRKRPVDSEEHTSDAYIQPSPVRARKNNNGGPTELLRALYDGNIELAGSLIKTGRQLNQKDRGTKWRPLTYAIVHNYVDIVQMLVEARVDVNTCSVDRNEHGYPLFLACKYGRHEVVNRLLRDTMLSLGGRDHKERSALHLAVESGCVRTVAALLSRPIDIKVTLQFIQSPLLDAIEAQNAGIVEHLVRYGFPIRAPELGKALRLGNKPIVETLLHSGKIELESAEWENSRALANAAAGGLACIEYVEHLLKLSSAKERQDALIQATRARHWHTANLILEHDAKQGQKRSLFSVSDSLPWYLESREPLPEYPDPSSEIEYRIYQEHLGRRGIFPGLNSSKHRIQQY